ncbi:hypothetical protein BRYFOR_07633 [Marvinbryantia formatexigens DSM 14469]|uniref:Uncharacterized protein n=1 Tax=Marvinbryantia formatexigens DSM 14469 TaxID=478749 RepID=C6LG73_9FIRM|nr:hypothetical protein [Marvinbryantia formatexigens]EET60437.1 hypothetical protein BRYFOR_07633 [Marvinbryantia formatexigens DSM 14469]UWO25224.1 hypothetical protein NQ534_01670 [Marvinbryantia formatexigens DSM 14469]SDH05396.1 hypothetical protein SAMN05660368_03764 [Marvinbryantia formatexigens]
MAKERVFMFRNTGTEEAPVWEKWFAKTVADAVMMSDADGEEQTVVDYVNAKIGDLIGGAPETYDTLKEIADYIASHKDVADALDAAVGNKVDKVAGKGLSTNDYTSEEKEKLEGVEEGATANDTLYKNQTPSTVAVGGIPKGYVPPTDGVEAIDMIDRLLHPYVAPTVSAAMKPANGGVVEAGTSQSVTAVDVTITMGSAAISKIEVFDGAASLGVLTSGIKAGVNTVTLTAPLTVTANKQLSVTVTDADNKTVTAKTGTYTFVSPYYYGSIAVDAAVNEALVKAATKSVTAKGNKTFTFTCSNQRMLFAYPKSYGNLAKILDANSFDVTGTFAKSEVTVDGVAYNVYVNDPSTVSAFKMTFNY